MNTKYAFSEVKIDNVASKPELNGKTAAFMRHDAAKGRCLVCWNGDEGTQMSLKIGCLFMEASYFDDRERVTAIEGMKAVKLHEQGQAKVGDYVTFTDSYGDTSTLRLVSADGGQGTSLQWHAGGLMFEGELTHIIVEDRPNGGLKITAPQNVALVATVADPVKGKAREKLKMDLVRMAADAGIIVEIQKQGKGKDAAKDAGPCRRDTHKLAHAKQESIKNAQQEALARLHANDERHARAEALAKKVEDQRKQKEEEQLREKKIAAKIAAAECGDLPTAMCYARNHRVLAEKQKVDRERERREIAHAQAQVARAQAQAHAHAQAEAQAEARAQAQKREIAENQARTDVVERLATEVAAQKRLDEFESRVLAEKQKVERERDAQAAEVANLKRELQRKTSQEELDTQQRDAVERANEAARLQAEQEKVAAQQRAIALEAELAQSAKELEQEKESASLAAAHWAAEKERKQKEEAEAQMKLMEEERTSDLHLEETAAGKVLLEESKAHINKNFKLGAGSFADVFAGQYEFLAGGKRDVAFKLFRDVGTVEEALVRFFALDLN